VAVIEAGRPSLLRPGVRGEVALPGPGAAGRVLSQFKLFTHTDALESRTLERLLASDQPKVLATGGGVVERPTYRELLRNTAAVVWLQVDPPTLQRQHGL